MDTFDNIMSIKNKEERNQKLKDFYKNDINIEKWLNIQSKNSIIHFKDRVEYKKNNQYHRINGPAIDYNNEKLDQYYYKGKKFESVEDWEKITIKDIRKVKLKKLQIIK